MEIETNYKMNESQDGVDDENQAKKQTVFVVTCDGHPTPRLRDIHNSNVLLLIFATFFDFIFFSYYAGSTTYMLFSIFGFGIPLGLNYTWLLVSYERKMRYIGDYNLVILLFVIAFLLGAMYLGFAVLVF